MLRIPAKHIIYIQSDGNYSNILLEGGTIRMVTLQLGQIENLISKMLPDIRKYFIRVGRSLIINVNNVYSINIPQQQLTLIDNRNAPYTLSPSKEALKALKDYIEKEDI